MIAALERIIDDDDVALCPVGKAIQDGLHACRHGAQMRRNVGRLRDQPPGAVEQGAGKVQALLDVGRIGRAPQRDAHFLGDAGKAVAVELEGYRMHEREEWINSQL